MVDPKDLARIVREFTGRDLSGQDLYDYGYFLKGAEDVFDAEKRERIRSELASIVMHNPGLARSVAEEHLKNAGDAGFFELVNFMKSPYSAAAEKQKALADKVIRHVFCSSVLYQAAYAEVMRRLDAQKKQEFSSCSLSLDFGGVMHQVGLVAKLDKEHKRLASAPDVYKYLKSLEADLVWGAHAQIEYARRRIKEMKSRMPLLTSTRIFYYSNSHTAKLVHNYGSPAEEQMHEDINMYEHVYVTDSKGHSFAMHKPSGNYLSAYPNPWDVIRQVLGTKDDDAAIRNILSGIYKKWALDIPCIDDVENITSGVVFFDSCGLKLYKKGIIWKEKWGEACSKKSP